MPCCGSRESPELATARVYIHRIMGSFVDHIAKVKNMERAREEAATFAFTCFDELYEQLLARAASMTEEPEEPGVAEAIGDAKQAFSELLPRVFYRFAEVQQQRVAQERQALLEQEEAQLQANVRAQEEAENEEWLQSMGNTSREFTTLLLNKPEELSRDENWNEDLRMSMHKKQLVDFLGQTGSHKLTYLVNRYEQSMDQLMTAQSQRLRNRCGEDKRSLLKELAMSSASSNSCQLLRRIPSRSMFIIQKSSSNWQKSMMRLSMYWTILLREAKKAS